MTENKKFDLHVLVSMQIEKSLTSFTLGVFFSFSITGCSLGMGDHRILWLVTTQNSLPKLCLFPESPLCPSMIIL